MAFYSPEKLRSRRIEIDESSVSSESPEVKKRLDRIETNYEQLDTILAELELKMEKDERLKAIDEANGDDFEETFGIKRKRKWRPAKKKSKKRKSTAPRKPR